MSAWINKMNNKRGAVVACAISISVLAITGCGGGGSSQTFPPNLAAGVSSPVTRQTGQVRLAITWPVQDTDAKRGRYVPTYASSLRFTLTGITDASRKYELLVERPPDASGVQTVTFADPILTGKYRLVSDAHLSGNGTDPAVATAAQEVQVDADKTTDARLTLVSTLSRIEILGDNLRTPVNVPIGLQARSITTDGATVFVPVGATGLRFTLTSGADTTGATITDTGLLTATKPGTVRVRVSEDKANVSAEVNVVIESNATGNNNGLAANAFAKVGGDARNSGQGYGPVAAAQGEQAWAFSDGDTLFDLPIIGPDSSTYLSGFRNGSAYLYAINPDGTKRWATETGGFIGTPTLAANGTLYTTDGNAVSAFRGNDGERLWKTSVSFYPGIAVNIGQNGLVFAAGFKDGGGAIAAIDGVSGQVRWTHDFASSAQGIPALSPDSNTVYVPTFDGVVYALDANTGVERWSFRAENGASTQVSAVVGPDGTVYLPEAGQFDFATSHAPSNVYALNGATGTLKWKKQFPEQFGTENTVAVSGSNSAVYVVSKTAGTGGGVFALNPANGSTYWNNDNVGTAPARGESSLTLGGGGTVYVVGYADGGLSYGVTALEPTGGGRLWTFSPDDGSPLGAVSIAPNGLVVFRNYLTNTKNEIRALR